MPKGRKGRFSVAVVHLDNDMNGDYERVVLSALGDVSEMIDVLPLDRVIAPKARSVEETVRTGHKEARRLMAITGAEVLIWGMVLRVGEKSIPKLYWTTVQHVPRDGQSRRYQLTDELTLPELSKDLTAVLDLLVLTGRGDYSWLGEAYARGKVSALIERLEELFETESQEWPFETRMRLTFDFANLYCARSFQEKDDAALEIAQSRYEEMLEELKRRGWSAPADILFRLAVTYLRLGTAKDDRAQVEKAARLFDDVANFYLSGIEVERYQQADQYCKQARRQLETLKSKPGGQTKIRGDAST